MTTHATASTMGLDTAIDELYASGWSAIDSTECETHADGRLYPGLIRIHREFARLGFDLAIRSIHLFDCYRAEWVDRLGHPVGAVVGATEVEAGVYALAQLRMRLRIGVKP